MNIANKISTFRILSVPFFIACFVYYEPSKDYLRFLALAIFFLGVVSDILDGYIARKAKLQSPAGLILDPLGDKLLLVSAFLCLFFTSNFPAGIRFPLWVIFIVISRDVIILLGVLVIFIVKQNIDINPTRWGKATTISQMAAIISVLTQWKYSYLVWDAAVIFTVISGVDYVRKGFILLYNSKSTA